MTIERDLTQEELKRLLKYDPETGEFTRRIALSNRSKVGEVVGTIKYNRNNNGLKNVYYKVACIAGTTHYLHRVAYLYQVGSFPASNMEIDHIDGDGTNNSWGNLRIASRSQNACNSFKAQNAIGKGICFEPRFNRYRARVTLFGVEYCKRFKVTTTCSKEQALQQAKLYIVTTREQLHKEFANHGN